MEIPKEKWLEMLAYEAFIRRAAEVDSPFMLKGSYVTRQYFPNPMMRLPNDLDWVYMLPLTTVEEARTLFDSWVTQVTELSMGDGVVFESFTKNAFWRMIDYAMADDFPTVNTDLVCWVEGEKFDWFSLDVSFNLDIEVPPVSLIYQPVQGELFLVPNTVPLALQVAWKMHQTLVRPRFKDIFDLTQLLKHPDFNQTTLEQTLQALVNECRVDQVDTGLLKWFFTGDLQPLFREVNVTDAWRYWALGVTSRNRLAYYEKAEYITDPQGLPLELADFVERFRTSLTSAGFTPEILRNLPTPTRKKRMGH